VAEPILACVTCNPALQQRLFGDGYSVGDLVALMATLILGGVAVTWLVHRVVRRHEQRTRAAQAAAGVSAAATLLGVGLGGFLDGIVFHQVLQWHQLISSRLPPTTLEAKNVNMFWDGLFHIVVWLFTLAGVSALTRQLGRADVFASRRLVVGAGLFGWGAFNAVDAVFVHFWFRYHNLREVADNPQMWNVGYLVSGLAMALTGALLMAHAIRKGAHAYERFGSRATVSSARSVGSSNPP
jgi:uncharacterized membrane protein